MALEASNGPLGCRLSPSICLSSQLISCLKGLHGPGSPLKVARWAMGGVSCLCMAVCPQSPECYLLCSPQVICFLLVRTWPSSSHCVPGANYDRCGSNRAGGVSAETFQSVGGAPWDVTFLGRECFSGEKAGGCWTQRWPGIGPKVELCRFHLFS